MKSNYKKHQQKSDTKIYLESIKSIRNKDMFILHNYLFSSKNKERTFFSCKQQNCRAFIHVFYDEEKSLYYTYDIPDHDFCHSNHLKEIKERKHKLGLLKECQNKSNEKKEPRQIALEYRNNNPSDRRLTLDSKFVSVHKEKVQHITKLSQIVINDQIKTILLYSNKSHSKMIFVDYNFWQYGINAKRCALDGTFSRSTCCHYQLITCHVVTESNFSFPFLFILLNTKKSSVYSEIIKKIDSIYFKQFGKKMFDRSDLTLSIDYEASFLKCFGELSCRISGCYWHHISCLYKQIKSNPFHDKYKKDQHFRDFFKILTLLPLFQEKEIFEIIDYLKTNFIVKYKDDDMLYIMNYYETTWIKTIKIKNYICFNSRHITNNICESFHAFLLRKISKHKPSFDVFVDSLVEIMNETKLKFDIERVNPKYRYPKDSCIKRITRLISNYYNDDIMRLSLNELLSQLLDIVFGGLIDECEIMRECEDEENYIDEEINNDSFEDEYVAFETDSNVFENEEDNHLLDFDDESTKMALVDNINRDDDDDEKSSSEEMLNIVQINKSYNQTNNQMSEDSYDSFINDDTSISVSDESSSYESFSSEDDYYLRKYSKK